MGLLLAVLNRDRRSLAITKFPGLLTPQQLC
jgi:hypothetical protein